MAARRFRPARVALFLAAGALRVWRAAAPGWHADQ